MRRRPTSALPDPVGSCRYQELRTLRGLGLVWEGRQSTTRRSGSMYVISYLRGLRVVRGRKG